nr:hypothetical protein Itr_chr15CG14990 [Ipomoea trifida]
MHTTFGGRYYFNRSKAILFRYSTNGEVEGQKLSKSEKIEYIVLHSMGFTRAKSYRKETENLFGPELRVTGWKEPSAFGSLWFAKRPRKDTKEGKETYDLSNSFQLVKEPAPFQETFSWYEEGEFTRGSDRQSQGVTGSGFSEQI